MTTLLDVWRHTVTATGPDLVLPDGCRDLIVVCVPGSAPTAFVSELHSAPVLATGFLPGTRLTGYRLAPGTRIETGLLLSRVVHTAEDPGSHLSLIEEHCAREAGHHRGFRRHRGDPHHDGSGPCAVPVPHAPDPAAAVFGKPPARARLLVASRPCKARGAGTEGRRVPCGDRRRRRVRGSGAYDTRLPQLVRSDTGTAEIGSVPAFAAGSVRGSRCRRQASRSRPDSRRDRTHRRSSGPSPPPAHPEPAPRRRRGPLQAHQRHRRSRARFQRPAPPGRPGTAPCQAASSMHARKNASFVPPVASSP